MLKLDLGNWGGGEELGVQKVDNKISISPFYYRNMSSTLDEDMFKNCTVVYRSFVREDTIVQGGYQVTNFCV